MWRVVDTGIRPQHENIALDRIMLELKSKGEIPSTIRFLQFDPECVLIGYHQSVEQEIRLEYVLAEGIEVGRRITGGGAIYFDKTQIGWEVISSLEELNAKNFEELTEKICTAVAKGLQKLGINAQFRPRNDIEVEGRKISGTGGVFEGNAFLFQGTILVDFNVERMLKSLQIPVEKLTSKGIKSAEDRVEWIKRIKGYIPERSSIIKAILQGLSETLKIEPVWGLLSDRENALLKERANEFRSREWIYEVKPAPQDEVLTGLYRCPGGTFRVGVKVSSGTLNQVIINGDFFVKPSRLIYDLEAYLKQTPIQDIQNRIREFFSNREWEGLNLTVEDFIEAVQFPLRKLEGEQLGLEKKSLNDIIASIGGNLIDNIQNAKVMLLPYCAKPRWCDYRHLDDCGECGGCTVGDAYRLAYQKGMIPITITSFELLRDTLLWCAKNGYTYIGHCCEEFFEKRYEIFSRASREGAKGVLFNIKGTTCYSLGVQEEEKAYHGEFTVELDLIPQTLNKTMEIKKDIETHSQTQFSFDFSPYFRRFSPPYYKKPKAVPTPLEDKTRLSDVFLGEATINESVVSKDQALLELSRWIKASERPTIVIGPLLFWDFGQQELTKKAKALENLIAKAPFNIKVLPDYRPKLKRYDPAIEMDPPNPHHAILHTSNDLTILIGVHCYRTDFVIRLLRKHTPTKVVALCGLYGHPEAHLSVSFTDAEFIDKLASAI
ncbi:MAG: carbon monoxide dehydrogenase beta subunit family protein [Aquificaceae bacterium]